MALEDLTGTKYLNDLVATNPTVGDNVSEGDDHIRGIKNVLKTTFPSIDGAITATDTELNYVDGVTSAIQTQLDSPVAKGDGSSADGYIQLNCSQNSHGIKLQSPPHSAGASYTLVFPNDDGNANEMLLTNGSGVLDWTTVGTSSLADDAVTGAKIADNVALAGSPTTTTQSASDNSTKIATTAYTDAAIAALADSAPSTLNTLNELAAALGDDANYATTTTNAIATKLPLAGGTMTGHTLHGDNIFSKWGASDDLVIGHDASNSYIDDTGTGDLILRGANNIRLRSTGNEDMIVASQDGAVNLFHNNVKKFETTSGGVTVTGDIANASGNMTLDVAGDITLDADGGDILFKDGGTGVLYFGIANSSATLMTQVSDADMIFKGNDGGSTVTALTLDMSAAGAATFNGKITADAGIDIDNFNIDGTTLALSSGNFLLDVAGNITLDSDNAFVTFADGGTDIGHFSHGGSGAFEIKVLTSDADMIFQGNDGGSAITALTLDMSAGGKLITRTDATVNGYLAVTQAGNATGFQVSTSVAAETTAIMQGGGTGAVDVLSVRDSNAAAVFRVLQNGRGVSQFTAKVWIRFNGTSTVAINDSHNVSSLQDLGTGNYYVNIDVDMANGNGSTTASGSAGMEDDGWDGNCIALMVNAGTIRVYSTAGGSLTDASAICVTGFGD